MSEYGGLSPFKQSIVTPAQIEAAERKKHDEVWAAIHARQKRDEQRAREQEQALREAGQARLDEYRGQAHQTWLRSGGTEEEFRNAWPRLRTEWLIEQSQHDPVEAKVQQLRASGDYPRF